MLFFTNEYWLLKLLYMIELENHHFAIYGSIILKMFFEDSHFLLIQSNTNLGTIVKGLRRCN